MSQTAIALIASGSVLAIVLATDLGRRPVTTWRLLRSVIAVAVVAAVFVRGVPTGGDDLVLQLAGVGAGVIGGLAAAALLPVRRDDDGVVRSVGGVGYAAVWVVLSAARVVFAYGAENVFGDEIVRFSIEHRISGQATYANAFVLMALAMVLTRTVVLVAHRRQLAVTAPRLVGAEVTR